MATNDAITAAISSAESLAITPTQMVALIDHLLASAVIDGKDVITYSINGRSVTRDRAGWMTIREDYRKLIVQSVGMVSRPIEFVAD